jgi:RNA polymerase sigma factor (sigma-70 family)
VKGVDRIVNDSFKLNDRIHYAIDTHANNIIKIAFTYVKNLADAEDIAQDTFLAYLLNKPDFQSDEHEKAWLIRVAINKCKNFLQTTWYRKTGALPDDLAYLPREESDLLQYVFALDVKYRMPIHLHYFEGYSIAEIAAILRTNPSTIGTRLARGRKILKLKMGGLEDE